MKWEQNDYDPSIIQTADAARTRIGRAPWEYAAQIVREHNTFEDLLEAAKLGFAVLRDQPRDYSSVYQTIGRAIEKAEGAES